MSYDADAVWDEVLDIASYGQRKLSSLSCCFRSCFLMSFVRISLACRSRCGMMLMLVGMRRLDVASQQKRSRPPNSTAVGLC